jgi:regulator of protease activity HflC (stomatin/prohibitin superfamily)
VEPTLIVLILSRPAGAVHDLSHRRRRSAAERVRRRALGRYHDTLNAGFHILVPFVDAIRYRHSLKEQAIDIPAQICITRDNVQVGVDGILYLKVLNAERASYGISDYEFAIAQLAQTTLRSEVGKIDLDRTFEERHTINVAVVGELDKASERGASRCCATRSRTSSRRPTSSPRWRSRCARSARSARVILTSEGQRDAAINTAEGEKQQVIKASEAVRQQQINEGGRSAPRPSGRRVGHGQGIREVAAAIAEPGGMEAVQLRVAEQYVAQFGEIAKKSSTVVVPANVSDVGA